MIHVVLYQPEIPNNTGSIIRLCANTGAQLHLVRPLGFELDDKRMRRAGLDYHEWAHMQVWESWSACKTAMSEAGVDKIYPMTTKATRSFYDQRFSETAALLFGPETTGLPEDVRMEFAAEDWCRLPMQPESRSLNLANAATAAVYEVWRQLEFQGALK